MSTITHQQQVRMNAIEWATNHIRNETARILSSINPHWCNNANDRAHWFKFLEIYSQIRPDHLHETEDKRNEILYYMCNKHIKNLIDHASDYGINDDDKIHAMTLYLLGHE